MRNFEHVDAVKADTVVPFVKQRRVDRVLREKFLLPFRRDIAAEETVRSALRKIQHGGRLVALLLAHRIRRNAIEIGAGCIR